MYICPDCRNPLQALSCNTCRVTFTELAGIPLLLPREPRFEASRLTAAYQAIYSKRQRVWEDQGRTPQFISYFAQLASTYSIGRVLEIGCGEGFLLSALSAQTKTATDLSAVALKQAQERSGASGCVALAERLPYPEGSFDLVVGVGVMEHFLFDREATSEVRRVLRDGGHYIALIHLRQGLGARIAQKIREYALPPRPQAFVRWLWGKLHNPIWQPIQRAYTLQRARDCLEQSGLRVVRTITRHTDPAAPLVGPHVAIYVTQK